MTLSLRLTAIEIKLLLDDAERLIINHNADNDNVLNVNNTDAELQRLRDRILRMLPVMYSIVESFISTLVTCDEDSFPWGHLGFDRIMDISKSLSITCLLASYNLRK